MAGTMCAILALLALRNVPKSCIERDNDTPWFCHDLDCPRYEVVETLAEEVELRSYDAGVWMSTNITVMDYDKAVRTGFMRLFAYISGANEPGQRIPMTAPVRVELTPGAGPFCEDHFKVSFFVPFDMQDAPLVPLKSEVYVDSAPTTDFYVMSYGGRTNERQILDRAMDLVQLLHERDLPYEFLSFYHAGYDSPFRIVNRHNEIWIEAKRKR